MSFIIQYFSNRFLPRWLVLTFDLAVVFFSWLLAYILRFNFEMHLAQAHLELFQLAVVFPVFLFCFRISRSYSGILRLSAIEDVLRVVFATIWSGFILTVISVIGRLLLIPSFMVMPVSVIIIHVLLVTGILVSSRLVVKLVYLKLFKNEKGKKNVIIFGAGELGQITFNALMRDNSEKSKIIAFIDDNPSLQNKHTAGVPIYSAEKAFSKIIPKKEVSELIFAVDQSKITQKRKREITDQCLENNLVVKEVPPVKTWIKGELKVRTIRRINIEDLLGRDAIVLQCESIAAGLKDSVVLVTGAAGSIGSEIVRQLMAFRVKQVILLDKAESDLYDLQQEILKNPLSKFKIIVGDVTNRKKLRQVFEEYSPNIVFNAAAYKHVPLMEEFPWEALRVNVGGTKHLADLSIEFNVEKFVFISTDKAVNPTNVMGASKRISEIYIQSLVQSHPGNTRFITTRFGNVLGSNGSVVPLFKKQIENGGPVTVTHKDITRYFMTIPEACQLVLEAGFMGKGGEIFVFDMGEPVKIYALAEKMISLSGFVPHKDIEIKVTGLRPGEKLYEELLDNREQLLPTHNDKILIGKVRKHEHPVVNKKITDLLTNIDMKSREELVTQMIEIVPEFAPMNPLYTPVEKAPILYRNFESPEILSNQRISAFKSLLRQ
ncbi:MAG: polysaccharide biosynthesis protein [Prolixibacteraceae bacterium]